MASDRLAAYLASTRAGIDDYPLMYNRHEGKAKMRVTIVCDLSLSMEAKLSRLSGESPLQRAIQLIKWLSENLRQQGIDFQIVGAHDAGRRPVYVRPLPLQTNDSIESLRSAGYGGFRLGGVLRGLHQHQSGLPSQRHFILAVTDAFGLYLSPGGDGTVSQIQDLCPSCRARSYCNLEREAAKRSAVEALHDGLYFVPDEQVWSDVADALESTNQIGFHLFAMDQDLASRKDVLDAHLATQWSDATSAEGILQGVLRLAEFAGK